MITNENNYERAYSEFCCLIKYLPKEYIQKLPTELMRFLKNQFNPKFKIGIDTNKSLLEQDFSERTKDLIAVIKYNYWSTDEEKKELKKAFNENENKLQMELNKKFNPNDLFINHTEQIKILQERAPQEHTTQSQTSPEQTNQKQENKIPQVTKELLENKTQQKSEKTVKSTVNNTVKSTANNNKEMIEYKENIFIQIMNKIKFLLKRERNNGD